MDGAGAISQADDADMIMPSGCHGHDKSSGWRGYDNAELMAQT